MYKHKQHGFTIVELLIVIVVIGILAAITMVAYNGMQQRAKVSKKQSEVSTIEKKIKINLVLNSSGFNSNTGSLSSLELGSLANDIVLADSEYDLTPCQSAPMTKDKYCLVAYMGSSEQYYVVVWWDDTKQRWVVTTPYEQRDTFDGSTSAPGTGDFPAADLPD